jgi:hypothetical protein
MLLRNLAPRSLSPRFLSFVSGNGFPARAPSPPPVAAASAAAPTVAAEPAVARPAYPVCQDLATTVLNAAIRRRCNTWATCGNRRSPSPSHSHSHSSNGLFALLLYNGLLFLLPRVLARSHNDCPSRLV